MNLREHFSKWNNYEEEPSSSMKREIELNSCWIIKIQKLLFKTERTMFLLDLWYWFQYEILYKEKQKLTDFTKNLEEII